jgi:hypothetical protein
LLGISVEELGDVKEVINALFGIREFEDVLRMQERKREERGRFGGIFLFWF